MIKYSFILLFFTYSLTGVAQTNRQSIASNNLLENGIDSIINKSVLKFLSDTTRVGLSVGIYYNNNSSIYHYGSTQKGKQILPTDKTIYEIGSISKTFAGTLLAQAVKDKKVKMDDDVRLYLDGNYPNLEYQGHPIKLSHLVSHISGLPNFLPDNPSFFQNISPDTLPFVLTSILNNYSKQNFFDDLHNVKIDTIPGYKFRYSNSSPQLSKNLFWKEFIKNPMRDF